MSFNERLKKIERSLEEQSEEKKVPQFRIPFLKKVSNSQKKKNYVTVVTLNENNGLDFKKEQIVNQSIMVNGIPRLATGDHIFYYKKNPFMFVPTFSVEPITSRQLLKESLDSGANTKGYKILLDNMLSNATKQKKDLNIIKWIGGLLLVGIIAYAFLG